MNSHRQILITRIRAARVVEPNVGAEVQSTGALKSIIYHAQPKLNMKYPHIRAVAVALLIYIYVKFQAD